MKFQASARKWRPQKFSQLIGQEHIVRTLKNAIELDRIAQAYLFSGTRGVGKTTSARLLAKALNCEQGPTPEPCDICTHCVEIRDGHSVDVLEIDGASNNGVAEARELIDNVQYSTSSCRYKVYIIDEVHMLSKSAFNALLKTLEEPPPGVVFIFATTEMNKIPETILSRCQHFEFKPLSHQQIMDQLQLICDQEEIKIDPGSLEEVAKNGAGSMRDAQSLLDQVIAFSGKSIDAGSVQQVLGIVGQDALIQFFDMILSKDGPALMQTVHNTTLEGKDLGLLCRDLLEYLRNLMIVKVAKESSALLDQKSCDIEALTRQAEAIHLDELQQMFQALSRAEMDMKRSSLPRTVFEMALIRMLDVRPFQNIDAMIDQINTMQPTAPASNHPVPAASPGPTAAPASAPAASSNTASNTASSPAPASPASAPVAGGGQNKWEQIKARAGEAKRIFATYLAQAEVLELSDECLHLAFPDPFTQGQADKDENKALLKEIAEAVMGSPSVKIKLDCRPASTPTPAQSDPASGKGSGSDKKKESPTEQQILQDAVEILGGTIIG
ncbi:MAG: DNA polymerase III subunit gamma/tau [Candidatus Nitronauta litoralis]|uniref:DNA polymerase III subunit gamma/tau n=1 Tax=Candidatus Nitronauta litoralis TaxID=2705533 RepID=A0A7T0BUY6_9BACT|nr:MAG: DNA polymerase III subunit gamma/tau [Candidatus Nitronauta litoralis]